MSQTFCRGKKRKEENLGRQREIEDEGREKENEGVKREKDCQKPLKDFTMKITYMHSSVDIYPLTVCTAREER